MAAALNKAIDYLVSRSVNPAGRPGWSHSKDGWVPPPAPVLTDSSANPWDLTEIDSEALTAKVNLGTILKSAVDLTDKFTITNGTSALTIAAGRTFRLKFTGAFDAMTVTLESGTAWTDYPAAVETTSSGVSAVFASYFYPLWEFVATSDATTFPITDDIHARKIAPSVNLLRTASTYHKSGDRPFAIPFLIPYHRALTA